ncbi:MAG: hypothetical protein ACR2PG_03595, partial [Hyphomicrobiaceae bacterium]
MDNPVHNPTRYSRVLKVSNTVQSAMVDAYGDTTGGGGRAPYRQTSVGDTVPARSISEWQLGNSDCEFCNRYAAPRHALELALSRSVFFSFCISRSVFKRNDKAENVSASSLSVTSQGQASRPKLAGLALVGLAPTPGARAEP